MADRYFANQMPKSAPEVTLNPLKAEETSDSLTHLLRLPYSTISQRFKEAALSLKQTVVRETWGSQGRRVKDYTLYTGVLGTAYLLFKSYQVTHDKNDLQLCSEIVHACETASRGSGERYVTFICGRAGVCALGAVAAKHVGDEKLVDYYLTRFMEIKLPRDVPNELLYGRAGYLWACSFLNKHIGNHAIPSSLTGAVAKDMIKEGRWLSSNARSPSPLMYEWHGKKYWGAAHGLAGIVHVLMDMKLKPDEAEDVKGTLRYMIRNRFPSGNYTSSEGKEDDQLVHWCHGAPGVALTLVKAAEVFEDQAFLQAAFDAADVVWDRGLLKRVGICHGVSGNAYVFLALYRLTGNEEFLYRAKGFACFLLDKANELILAGKMHAGDHPYSLFEGVGGMAYLLLDMVEPFKTRFPAYEL